jgi:hypothetical protein
LLTSLGVRGVSFGHAPFDEQSTDDELALEHAARTAKTTASGAKASRRRIGRFTLAYSRAGRYSPVSPAEGR